MVVRCKFKLQIVTRKLGSRYVRAAKASERGTYEPCEQYDAKFTAVYSDDPESENKRCWDSTPSGTFEVTTIKEMPWVLGQEYYLDITPAE